MNLKQTQTLHSCLDYRTLQLDNGLPHKHTPDILHLWCRLLQSGAKDWSLLDLCAEHPSCSHSMPMTTVPDMVRTLLCLWMMPRINNLPRWWTDNILLLNKSKIIVERLIFDFRRKKKRAHTHTHAHVYTSGAEVELPKSFKFLGIRGSFFIEQPSVLSM